MVVVVVVVWLKSITSPHVEDGKATYYSFNRKKKETNLAFYILQKQLAMTHL